MLNILHEVMNELNNKYPKNIYNEISLQFEIGIKLREKFKEEGKSVFFEKNISNFHFDVSGFLKREIDIVVSRDESDEKIEFAVELKFPTNGQRPVQMFNFLKDIKFLKQIRTSVNNSPNYFIAVCDSGFYSRKNSNEGVYRYFRCDDLCHPEPISGKVIYNNFELDFEEDSYQVIWHNFRSGLKYMIIEV